MPFGLVSAWNKRRRSKSEDHINPCMFQFLISRVLLLLLRYNLVVAPMQFTCFFGDQFFNFCFSFSGVYKPVECWKIEGSAPPAKRHHGSAVFTLKEMEEATHSFSEQNLLGKGGFGRVYKGTLRSGEIVAIKKMDLPSFKAAEGEREFRVEVDILSRLDHPNLVSLIGYCADGKHRFLVYEYMPRGNLQDHLNGIGELKMDWPLRLKVALGAARGLAYLHSSSAVGIPIVHRDFKSTNILLDNNFEAKISDFGLAKLMPEGQETCVTARVLGTFGYFDPEYTLTGKLTLQSDVYAFGVVLLELLTGRRAVDLNQGPNDQNLVLQVRHILNDKKRLRKIIDPDMSRNSYTMESIAMFASLASRCVRIDSTERPSMIECVKELQLIVYTNSRGLGMTLHTFRMI
ncbi:probable serine/threonine-protein kinase PBL28 isoform X1 [Coffea eugenioides]|uniref:probable serine/threonine-protein kinase PBL28 isoform X1 n=1 Tax=Coffea eugenioides TaxID=49369 RepID=UPI000F614F83|nr:probable serine/threonine-protein kinase PBL28 isoform X1 [Coffea eugenioides]XP_027151027.1 probable serine/threonine-protein kinase PBL28 isoform X1 [Coffea eugenioides]XP_027151028.1 probable serine/threonine-protein kinase PBL28 isoform X1 [Coffea eugenioides]